MNVRRRHVIEQDRSFAKTVARLAEPYEPRDRPVGAGRRIGEIHEMVRREIGMQREAEDPALARREDIGEHERGLGLKLAVCEDADTAGPLGDEQPAVRRERQAPGNLEAGGNDLNAERRSVARRQRCHGEAAGRPRWRRLVRRWRLATGVPAARGKRRKQQECRREAVSHNPF